MRLVFAAVIVVGAFAFVLLLMSRLYPAGAGWAGVCLVMTCLYASVLAAWAFLGNDSERNAGTSRSQTARSHPLRDNLLYLSLGMALVTVAIAIAMHDVEKDIHREFKNDWLVGAGSACVALGYTARAFWTSRRNWRLWALIAASFALFTGITIPFFSQMGKVPLLLMGPLVDIEFLVSIAAFHWIIGRQPEEATHSPRDHT